MSLTETCHSGRVADNEKKTAFSPPNKTNAFNSFFFRSGGRDYVDQWKKRRPFSPPNKTKSIAEIPCDALNAPQFKPIEISNSRCTALNEIACIKCNAVSTLYVAALDSLKANLMTCHVID